MIYPIVTITEAVDPNLFKELRSSFDESKVRKQIIELLNEKDEKLEKRLHKEFARHVWNHFIEQSLMPIVSCDLDGFEIMIQGETDLMRDIVNDEEHHRRYVKVTLTHRPTNFLLKEIEIDSWSDCESYRIEDLVKVQAFILHHKLEQKIGFSKKVLKV